IDIQARALEKGIPYQTFVASVFAQVCLGAVSRKTLESEKSVVKTRFEKGLKSQAGYPTLCGEFRGDYQTSSTALHV
ncbi:MAG: hypothetical protein R3194_10730, partial [Limnobacter sp.]|nr:hypothetical protein [Limnobacter sp.]